MKRFWGQYKKRIEVITEQTGTNINGDQYLNIDIGSSGDGRGP